MVKFVVLIVPTPDMDPVLLTSPFMVVDPLIVGLLYIPPVIVDVFVIVPVNEEEPPIVVLFNVSPLIAIDNTTVCGNVTIFVFVSIDIYTFVPSVISYTFVIEGGNMTFPIPVYVISVEFTHIPDVLNEVPVTGVVILRLVDGEIVDTLRIPPIVVLPVVVRVPVIPVF